MKAQHTPGPWGIGCYVVNDYAQEIYASGIKVAAVEGWRGEAQSASDANARLIAAAPELLEALKNVLDELHKSRKMNVKKDFSLLIADSVARKAIYRAEGQEA